MGKLVYEGQTKVWFVTGENAIADISAPSAAVIGAGTNITPYLTKDGLSVPNSTNNVDTAGLDETFDAQVPGSWGGSITLTMFRDDTADDAWDLFSYGTRGFLVVGRFGSADVAADVVEVYPVTAHQKVPQATAANENQRFTVELPVRAEPDLEAVVAA